MSLTINAVYTSPNDTNTFVIPVEAAAATEESSQADQTNHVKAVREAVTKLQDQVNKYLTERMEVEKNDAAKALEDNYGEEIVDEEVEPMCALFHMPTRILDVLQETAGP
ncbi:hypothetical protein BZA77DRAFT_391241 [Pyronema omphalodes]|nr:hypothetical protein BZA77DRAFT_391241 [Pyronema omphalodes]